MSKKLETTAHLAEIIAALGVVDDAAWSTYQGIICSLYGLPGNQQGWSNHRGILDPDFVEIVEGCQNESD